MLKVVFQVMWSFVIWIIIIVFTFIILEYMLNRKIIGMKSTVGKDKMLDFAKATTLAPGDKSLIVTSEAELHKVDETVKRNIEVGKAATKIDAKELAAVVVQEETALKAAAVEGFASYYPW